MYSPHFQRWFLQLPASNGHVVFILDVGEVNGLTVDWVSRHVYWTDSKFHSIELADFDGSNRRVLSIDDLDSPRGIVADPSTGSEIPFLFLF